MKKLFIAAALVFAVAAVQAQNDASCNAVSLKTEADIKSAEPCIIKGADYVLSKPLHANDPNITEYRKMTLAWMDKTPDFTFSLNGEIMKLAGEKDNELLFGTYAVCLAKAALENKTNATDEALKLLAGYIANEKNGVKQTGAIKKFLKAVESGDFAKYR